MKNKTIELNPENSAEVILKINEFYHKKNWMHLSDFKEIIINLIEKNEEENKESNKEDKDSKAN